MADTAHAGREDLVVEESLVAQFNLMFANRGAGRTFGKEVPGTLVTEFHSCSFLFQPIFLN